MQEDLSFQKILLQTKTKKDPTCATFSNSRHFEYDTERGCCDKFRKTECQKVRKTERQKVRKTKSQKNKKSEN
jgi:hypothetical protein